MSQSYLHGGYLCLRVLVLLPLAVSSAQAQSKTGRAPSPNSLLNNLKSIQFSSTLPSEPEPRGQNLETAEVLSCTRGPRGSSWNQAKQRFRNIFQSDPPWIHGPKETLSATMEGALADLNAAQSLSPDVADECGLGKLCIQLLSFSAAEDPTALVKLFASFEQIASPVLTMLLDVPWVVLAHAGWPIFGLLSQINGRKATVPGALNDDSVDGMQQQAALQFQTDLANGLNHKDGMAVQRAADSFLREASNLYGSVLGALTAMAAQALACPEPQERMQLLTAVQQGFAQTIRNGSELDVALSTKWPLWGLIHGAIDGLMLD